MIALVEFIVSRNCFKNSDTTEKSGEGLVREKSISVELEKSLISNENKFILEKIALSEVIKRTSESIDALSSRLNFKTSNSNWNSVPEGNGVYLLMIKKILDDILNIIKEYENKKIWKRQQDKINKLQKNETIKNEEIKKYQVKDAAKDEQIKILKEKNKILTESNNTLTSKYQTK